jgi:hypothetical protein
MAAIYSNGSNHWNILGFNFTMGKSKYGQIESQIKNDKFWINFYAWKDGQYGARGPTELQWDVILREE